LRARGRARNVEEQQRHRRIEIDVMLAGDGLHQAHAAGQDDRQGDRHVHVDASGRQCRQRRPEEGQAGIGDRRQGDQRRQPVHQVAGRRPHAFRVAGPHRDRQQHDVASGEAGDRHRPQQRALSFGRGIVRHGIVERRQPVAERGDALHQRRRIGPIRPPDEAQAARRHVDPRRDHAGLAHQDRFDQPNAGRAVQPVDRERQRRRAVGPVRHVGREIEAGRLRVRLQRPGGRIEHAAPVVGIEAEAADGLPRGRAARTAERAVRLAGNRLPAMAAGRYCVTIRSTVR